MKVFTGPLSRLRSGHGVIRACCIFNTFGCALIVGHSFLTLGTVQLDQRYEGPIIHYPSHPSLAYCPHLSGSRILRPVTLTHSWKTAGLFFEGMTNHAINDISALIALSLHSPDCILVSIAWDRDHHPSRIHALRNK